MSALAEKLKAAGADTVGARITCLGVEGLRLYHGRIGAVWAYIGAAYGYDLIAELAKDMKLPELKPAQVSGARGASPQDISVRKKLQELVRSKYKNSTGIAWSEVGWHELRAMARDGSEASALLDAGPANVPNDGRTVGQVLGVKTVDKIIEMARAA